MFKILITDPLHDAGIELLGAQDDVTFEVKQGLNHEGLVAAVRDVDALIVRSESKVTLEVLQSGGQLQVVGRAGVGVDNIDLDAATRRGVAVVNAPTGNIMAASEHTIAMLLALARNVSQADASMKKGEWLRSAFMGVEVRGKVLGIIGLGRVGSEVARRARGMDMEVIAYDPFVAVERANRVGVELGEFEWVLSNCDFLTLHTPLSDSTKHLIGKREIKLLKPTVRIVNVARGDLIDEEALLDALIEGTVAGVALDVFSKEPPADLRIVQHPKVVTTPHLGASTIEAQSGVATEVVEQVLAVLHGQPAPFTVNVPLLAPEDHVLMAPYLQVLVDLGKIAIQLSEGQLSSIRFSFEGDIGFGDTTILKAAGLMGLLDQVTEERVNLVNALLVAEQRGIQVTEEHGLSLGEYTNLISIRLTSDKGDVIVTGTQVRERTHLIRVSDYWFDVSIASPYLLLIENLDRPGMIGAVGGIAGDNDINISFMEVGRLEERGRAMMVVGVDDLIAEPVLTKLRSMPNIYGARLVRM